MTRMTGSLGSERGSRLEVGLGLLDLTDEAGDLRVGVGGRPAGPLEEDDPAELLLQVADALLGLRVVDLLLTGGNPFLGLLTGLPGGILGLVEEAHLFSLSRCEPGYPASRRSFAGGLRRPPPLVPSRPCGGNPLFHSSFHSGRDAWLPKELVMQTEPDLRASGGTAPGTPSRWPWADAEPVRRLLACSSEVITIGDMHGTVLWVSPSVERVLGYPVERMVGTQAVEHIHPDDVDRVVATVLSTAAGENTGPVTVRCRHRDGSWRYFESTYTNLLDEPGVRGIVANARDVSDRVQAEAALRSSEEGFRTFASSAPVGIIFTDADARVTYVNDRWLEITGIPRDEARGDCWARVTHPDDVDAVLASSLEALERAGRSEFSCRMVRPDGTVIWVRGQTVQVRGADGTAVGFVSSLEDVTAERAAREREARWSALVQHSQDMVSIYDAGGRFVFASPSHERVLGYKADELLGTSPLDLLHPDERDQVATAFADQLLGPSAPAPVEHRFLHKDGSWRYVESIAVNLSNDPAIGGILVNARDVTDRRRAELVSAEQARILDGVARGVPVRATLDAVVEMIERWTPGGRGAITRFDPEEGTLHVAAAPSLDATCID